MMTLNKHRSKYKGSINVNVTGESDCSDVVYDSLEVSEIDEHSVNIETDSGFLVSIGKTKDVYLDMIFNLVELFYSNNSPTEHNILIGNIHVDFSDGTERHYKFSMNFTKSNMYLNADNYARWFNDAFDICRDELFKAVE